MAFNNVQIVSTRNGSTPITGWRQDLAIGDVLSLSLTDTTGVSSYRWELVGRPEGSMAGGPGPEPILLSTGATAGFNVDDDSGMIRDGTYTVHCTLNGGAPTETIIKVGMARLYPGLSLNGLPLRKLAAGETDEDTSNALIRQGYATMLNRWLGITQSHSVEVANWDITKVRYVFLDGDNGDDRHIGYIDAAPGTDFTSRMSEVAAVAIKTTARLRAITPLIGAGRMMVRLIKPRFAAGHPGIPGPLLGGLLGGEGNTLDINLRGNPNFDVLENGSIRFTFHLAGDVVELDDVADGGVVHVSIIYTDATSADFDISSALLKSRGDAQAQGGLTNGTIDLSDFYDLSADVGKFINGITLTNQLGSPCTSTPSLDPSASSFTMFFGSDLAPLSNGPLVANSLVDGSSTFSGSSWPNPILAGQQLRLVFDLVAAHPTASTWGPLALSSSQVITFADGSGHGGDTTITIPSSWDGDLGFPWDVSGLLGGTITSIDVEIPFAWSGGIGLDGAASQISIATDTAVPVVAVSAIGTSSSLVNVPVSPPVTIPASGPGTTLEITVVLAADTALVTVPIDAASLLAYAVTKITEFPVPDPRPNQDGTILLRPPSIFTDFIGWWVQKESTATVTAPYSNALPLVEPANLPMSIFLSGFGFGRTGIGVVDSMVVPHWTHQDNPANIGIVDGQGFIEVDFHLFPKSIAPILPAPVGYDDVTSGDGLGQDDRHLLADYQLIYTRGSDLTNSAADMAQQAFWVPPEVRGTGPTGDWAIESVSSIPEGVSVALTGANFTDPTVLASYRARVHTAGGQTLYGAIRWGGIDSTATNVIVLWFVPGTVAPGDSVWIEQPAAFLNSAQEAASYVCPTSGAQSYFAGLRFTSLSLGCQDDEHALCRVCDIVVDGMCSGVGSITADGNFLAENGSSPLFSAMGLVVLGGLNISRAQEVHLHFSSLTDLLGNFITADVVDLSHSAARALSVAGGSGGVVGGNDGGISLSDLQYGSLVLRPTLAVSCSRLRGVGAWSPSIVVNPNQFSTGLGSSSAVVQFQDVHKLTAAESEPSAPSITLLSGTYVVVFDHGDGTTMTAGNGVRVEYAPDPGDGSQPYTAVSWGSLRTTGFEVVGGQKVVCRITGRGYEGDLLPCPRCKGMAFATVETPAPLREGTIVSADVANPGKIRVADVTPPQRPIGFLATSTVTGGFALVSSDSTGGFLLSEDAGAIPAPGTQLYLSQTTPGTATGTPPASPVLLGLVQPSLWAALADVVHSTWEPEFGVTSRFGALQMLQSEATGGSYFAIDTYEMVLSISATPLTASSKWVLQATVSCQDNTVSNIISIGIFVDGSLEDAVSVTLPADPANARCSLALVVTTGFLTVAAHTFEVKIKQSLAGTIQVGSDQSANLVAVEYGTL
jgi:hypothetical protein